MSAGTTTFRTILEKPLNQLTEDDISQLTREDCPQIPKRKRNAEAFVEQIAGDPAAASAKEASADVQVSASAEEPVPNQKHEQQKPVHQDRPADAVSKAISPTSRNQCTTDASVRQMTIFYCGKVNVYDGVLPDKARTIMHLAARPNHLPLDNHFSGTAAARSLRCQFQTAGDKEALSLLVPSLRSCKQRRLLTILSCTGIKGTALVILMVRQVEESRCRDTVKSEKTGNERHASNGNSSRSSTSSPPQQPGLLQAADNHPKIRCLPVDLNENDILEC
ncbi:hypothetical protein M0R45_018219 [Rubus argutus]|uniref:Protein TIFY n=1 Tax=Rubus argutus TaxID=59490 RepID=A0AAW1X599_RUBAR